MSSEDRTTAAQRIRIALDLFDLGEKMLRQRLRRSRPGASEAEIETEVIAVRPKPQARKPQSSFHC